MATGVQLSRPTPSQLESTVLMTRQDTSIQRTAQRTLSAHIFHGFCTGAAGGLLLGSIFVICGLVVDKEPKTLLPAMASCILGSCIGGIATRIMLFVLKIMSLNSWAQGAIGSIGAALFGASIGLGAYVDYFGIPFTPGASTGDFFLLTSILAGLGALMAGQASARDLCFASICFGAGMGSLMGMGIGATIGLAIGSDSLGVLTGSFAGLGGSIGFLIGSNLKPLDEY